MAWERRGECGAGLLTGGRCPAGWRAGGQTVAGWQAGRGGCRLQLSAAAAAGPPNQPITQQTAGVGLQGISGLMWGGGFLGGNFDFCLAAAHCQTSMR